MRIGIDVSSQAFRGFGVQVYVENIVRRLLEVDEENEYVLLGGSLRGRRKIWEFMDLLPKRAAVTPCVWPLPPKLAKLVWNDWHVLAIDRWLGSLDVFHTSGWTEPPTVRAAKVSTVHDLTVFRYPETMAKETVRVEKKRLEIIKRESTRVICVSEATARDLIELVGVERERIRVIHEGVDGSFYRRDKREVLKARAKWGVGEEYILAVGTREPRKNMRRLIKAVEGLRERGEFKGELVIAGKVGWGEETRRKKWVKLLGYVLQEDLPALYSGARVFVFPSLLEGFGLPILEAMGCGCGVVTSNVSSMSEVAGRAAILVDPLEVEVIGEGIKKALRKEKSLRKAGYNRVKEFCWEKAARETLEVYKEAADEGRRG